MSYLIFFNSDFSLFSKLFSFEASFYMNLNLGGVDWQNDRQNDRMTERQEKSRLSQGWVKISRKGRNVKGKKNMNNGLQPNPPSPYKMNSVHQNVFNSSLLLKTVWKIHIIIRALNTPECHLTCYFLMWIRRITILLNRSYDYWKGKQWTVNEILHDYLR